MTLKAISAASLKVMVVVAVAACGGSSADTQPDGGSSGSNDGGDHGGDGGSTCVPSGTSTTSSLWALPESPEVDLSAVAGPTSCPGGGYQQWATIDLTGDGRPDLVLTDACDDPSVGTSRWLVYANTGAGFATAGTPWSLPSTYQQALGVVGGFSSCSGAGYQRWSTFDLTGDGKPELVITDVCADNTIGKTHWSVHANTGSGFAEAATSWSIPDAYTLDLGVPSGFSSCPGSGYQQWSTVDLTGDGLPELIVTDDCADSTTGHSRWLVHANTGSGFAATASLWSIPSSYQLDLGVLGGFSSCPGEGYQRWSTLDLTGDGIPELVITDVCADGTIGKSRWSVHANTGSGFAEAATPWSIPDAYTLDLGVPSAFSSCPGSGYQQWSTVDLTGDGLPELIVTDDCAESTTGHSRWLVHANTGSGFAAAASEWSIPSSYQLDLGVIGGFSSCAGSGYQRWSMLDLTGDRLPEIVVTSTCGDASVGRSDWLVHAPVCP
ncbi:MAG TPA: VCBS repeat-containing protein [Kofleriaceae bacterium]|jgi:hypothetical protein